MLQNEYIGEIKYEYHFSPDKVKAYEKILNLHRLYEKGLLFPDTLSEEIQEIFWRIDSYGEDFYSILNGCSWYCGAKYDVECSSNLPSQGIQNYKCGNLSNFTLKDAWIEGVRGNGVGQKVKFIFHKSHPRLTNIYIANGYVRTQKLYKEHGRVKRFRLSFNGQPIGYLNLLDVYGIQSIVLDSPLVFDEDVNVLEFEILEVYNGDKFSETAISELYFDGLDVH